MAERGGWRINFERSTVEAMIGLYCRGVHGGRELCAECRGLLEYARLRIDSCPRLPGKPVCSACSVHCYKSEHRESIRKVMRYAGPRMPGRHPLRAIVYLVLKNLP